MICRLNANEIADDCAEVKEKTEYPLQRLALKFPE